MKATALARPVTAWATFGISSALFAASLILVVGGLAPGYDPEIGMAFVASLLIWGALGALLAARLPGHPIGWLFCGVALVAQITFLAEVYVGTVSGSPPALGAIAWLETVGGDWATPLFVLFILLLFPSGRLSTPLARIAGAAALAVCALGAIGTAFAPGKLDRFPIENPLGIQGFEGASAVIEGLSSALLAAVFVLAFAVLLARFRRASGIERQQLKWFVFAAAILAFDLALTAVVVAVGLEGGDWVGILLFLFGLVGLPVATTIAILRYRLFDIDRIISRTLAYGLLTALLAGGLLRGGAGAAIGAARPRRLPGHRGRIDPGSRGGVRTPKDKAQGGSGPPLQPQPLRRRAHRLGVRRTAPVGSRARLAVADLVNVVERTVHPAHASLWLRSEGEA